jgi:hypothetical protein
MRTAAPETCAERPVALRTALMASRTWLMVVPEAKESWVVPKFPATCTVAPPAGTEPE